MDNENIKFSEDTEEGAENAVENASDVTASDTEQLTLFDGIEKAVETSEAPVSEGESADKAVSDVEGVDKATPVSATDTENGGADTKVREDNADLTESGAAPKPRRGRPRKKPLPDPDTDNGTSQLTLDIPDCAPVFEEETPADASTEEKNEEYISEDAQSSCENGENEGEETENADIASEVSECGEANESTDTLSVIEEEGEPSVTEDTETENEPDGEFIIPAVVGGELFPDFTEVSEDIANKEETENAEDEQEEMPSAEEPKEEEPKEEEPKPEKPKRPKKEREVGSRGVDTLFDFLELFIFTFVGVLLVTTFIFRHSVVSGNSMINTLHDGDKLIISDLFYSPDYGDIVVVEDHTANITSPIVKRVIALEGDTVRVTHGGIFVNGVLEDTVSYVYTDGTAYFYDLDDYRYFKDYEGFVFEEGQYYEFIVPENEIYVLGDHRNDSTDSRRRGTVREDSVLGRVIVRFYPFENFKFFN